PTPVVMQPMRAMLRNELLSAVMILLATTAIAWMFGVRLTRPLAELTKHISQRGSLDHLKFDDPSRDEVWSLVRAFAEMSNDLILEAGQARKVFEHAVDGLLTTDGHGTILTINPAAYRMFGHPPGSLEGQPISRLIPESYRAAHDHHMDRLLSNEAQPMAELREVSALRSDGACFPVEVRVSRVSNDGGGLFVAIVHDITTRLEAEREQRLLIEKLEGSNATNAELERAKAELERSNAELDRFAYVASHDLRAPLRVIDNASRWLEEDLAEHLDDDTRESMDLLRSRVFRMEQLLKDLLEHSRIGRVSLSDAMVDGRELVENIWALTAMPDAFHFEVDAVFEAITLPQFPIQTVLVNLVSNAVKHHDRPNGKVSLSVSEATDHYVFEVTDDGPGIPAQYQEKVFDMFQTLKPRDDVEGSGMGLAIVKKTIEVAGGAIHLTSVLGEGCCFRVTWPRARTQAGEEAAA
ncbi:MAG: PAS domain S-box protein, partial [Gammaproteobacteria bacterium]|nr:PAS domain S-box protein [Gammaproteobacteria bacterium]